jgi:hypothetical protein
MARIVLCPTCAGKVHVEVGGRSVCVGSKDAALGAVRNAVQLGIASIAEGEDLRAQVNRQIGLTSTEAGLIAGKSCGLPHTFVRGVLDALDVMCGTGASHPSDVN